MNISLFPNIRETKKSQDIPIDLFLERVKSGFWQDEALAVRVTKTDEAKAEAKRRVPYVTISGKFAERNESGLISHSGFIAIDIDDVADIGHTKSMLCPDRYVYACFVSVSGRGLCLLFRINAEKHREAFRGIAEYLLENYEIVCDSLPDVSRPRYVSWDPDIYINNGAEKFAKYPKKEPKAMQRPPEVVFVQSDFDDIVKEIVSRGVDITGDYFQWVKCCFAIVDRFGESGRQYFHAVSQFGKYNPKNADRQYNACLKAGRSGVTIASFYFLAKQAGIEITSIKTKTISQYAALGKKRKADRSDVVKLLEEQEQISPEDCRDIVDQIYNNNIQVEQESALAPVKMWLRQAYDLRRNIITRNIENGGKPMDDHAFNSTFIAGIELFEKLSRNNFEWLVYSDFVPDYNPFLEFIAANRERKPTGCITALFDTLKSETGLGVGEFCPDYKGRFGTKWLLGIISSIYGQHSPLMLVLTGETQGTGKTEWFRRLLPEQLRDYYAEAATSGDKDDHILMTKKLVVMYDELSKMSTRDTAAMKELLSKQIFSLREPYGRRSADLRRLAVLCGTANASEILDDPTGNRRIIPIHVTGIDNEKYNAIDKTDLFIEVYNLYAQGSRHDLSLADRKILADNTSTFQQSNAESELVAAYFEKPEIQGPGGLSVFMSTTQILARLQMISGYNKMTPKRMGLELKRLGWNRTTRRINGNDIPTSGYWVIERGVVG